MSDEMLLAKERASLYSVILTLGLAITLDAVAFCVFGVCALATIVMGHPTVAFQRYTGLAAFTGILFIGMHYIRVHYLKNYEADGGLL